jgi:hypothetical protein
VIVLGFVVIGMKLKEGEGILNSHDLAKPGPLPKRLLLLLVVGLLPLCRETFRAFVRERDTSLAGLARVHIES